MSSTHCKKNVTLEVETVTPFFSYLARIQLCFFVRTEDDLEAWYPPGHGDFYQAFANSGLLNEFIDQVKFS